MFFLAGAALAAVLIRIPAHPVFAWGRFAHRRSAKLADSRLSPRTRAMIRELLEPGESLADASTWADEHNREIRGSTYWHFVNVPIWASHYDPRDCRPQGCVISKIAEFKATLRSGDSIGRAYEPENVPKAAERLERSGVRLAAMLEEVFRDADPRANPPRGILQEERPVPARK